MKHSKLTFVGLLALTAAASAAFAQGLPPPRMGGGPGGAASGAARNVAAPAPAEMLPPGMSSAAP
jgi:hypothetical protein